VHRLRGIGFGVAFCLAPLLLAAPAAASSQRAKSVEELLTEAEAVFEGRVVGLEVEDGVTRPIRTCARFQVLEVVKAPPRGLPATVRLCFAGGRGRAGERSVEGVHVPALGEHGVYFVESLARPLVNPLLGWDQGRFRILADPDRPEGFVASADGRGVASVDDGRGAPPGLSDGVARGVGLAEAPAATPGAAGLRRGPPARPLTPDEFKQRLRALLPATP
jgi:hypothetical protein